ncbi:putative glycerol kinase, glycosomal [Trypanosoma rangeli]|uniref:Putative glycerol kinase, glycosomal n=1 Tax=Trypanosoma rangeli TaxID=5698 RepID=A0A3R7MHX6_TRYRA|nr:putative glycerol kinase, glycosomal [Trypanosoma rangeli]RNF06181.1 putative glycerol kinase, glycosomal [Trypanosoma rangeli]|eukprot:RNF06181.1 putative glycerol kinase, glycosomal [Trypanosoma rangeli]
MGTVVLPPFVAAAIVEHAKRRRSSAGYLVGSRSGNQISITDYIPCTHESTDDVRTRTYLEELKERVSLKKSYTPSITLVGWYAAATPEPENEREFELWCQAPGARFTKNQAVMLVVRMPSATDISIRWEAYITNNLRKGDTAQCERRQQLAVSMEAETPSMNVMLSEIISKTLCGGGVPYPTDRITNLDHVAADAAAREGELGRKDGNRKDAEARQVESALLKVQEKLNQAISHARAILASGHKPSSESAAIVENYETILAEKKEQSSRDNFITESYKDALMIKYTAALLRRHLTEIERHGRQDMKDKTHHGQGGVASPHGPRKLGAAFR